MLRLHHDGLYTSKIMRAALLKSLSKGAKEAMNISVLF